MGTERTDLSAKSFFNFARDYLNAANQLFDIRQCPSQSAPIDFLYFHAVELAIKAFLLSHDKNPWGHELTELFEECRSLGLVVGPHPYEMGDIVNLLESGNEEQGFRYPTWKLTASLSWIREVVEKVVQAVEPDVEAWHERDPSRTLGKLKLTIGKPVPKPGRWASVRSELTPKRPKRSRNEKPGREGPARRNSSPNDADKNER